MVAKNNKKSEKGSGDKQPQQQQPAKTQKKVNLLFKLKLSLEEGGLKHTRPFALTNPNIVPFLLQNLDKVPKKATPVSSSKKQGSTPPAKGGCAKSGGCRAAATCCRWIFGSFVLVLAIAAAINYDVHIHGGQFEKSATGKFLKDTGMLPHVETVFYTSMSHGARGFQFMEKNVPVYSKETGSVLKPYWEFTKDLAVVAVNGVKQGFKKLFNLVDEKSPAVVDFVSIWRSVSKGRHKGDTT